MKKYNEYMDRISVSDTLHHQIIARTSGRPRRWSIMIRRYTASIVAVAAILLVVITIPRLLQNRLAPIPDGNPSVLKPGLNTPKPNGSNTPVKDTKSKYTLHFNKVDSQSDDSANKISIKGHFWQELSNTELKAIFPSLIEKYNITATANFQSDEGKASFYNIEAQVGSSAELQTYIQLAPNEVMVDYLFDVEAKVSNILGTTVTAGYYVSNPNKDGDSYVACFATFGLNDISYYVELSGSETVEEAVKNEISDIVVLLIEGNVTDLNVFHPVIPELRNESLSIDEARADADFGQYIPKTLPKGFGFEFANRFINQQTNSLFVNWTKGINDIRWSISIVNEHDKKRVTAVTDTKNYDLKLYPIPRAESVPDDLREIVDNPIFPIDELTIDTVRARTYKVSDKGDSQGPRMRFSVLYGDVLVELSAKGVAPEEMFQMLEQIKK
jgi:hypothetical protein